MGKSFSISGRGEMFSKLTADVLDVVVIGGGATGAGILLDAVSRGMSTGLFEMQDFAAGTSSRSTKLIHGGLRYLKQFEVDLVAEVGQERAVVYENAPHVTTPVWMLLPIVEGGTYGMFLTSAAVYVYDRLARVRQHERRKMLSLAEAVAKEPLLRQDILKGAGYYVEYRTDDARLTIEIIKEAVERGAVALNYAKVTKLEYERGRVVGVRVTDTLSGQEHVVRARKVVNATGPWVDELRELDGSKAGKTLHWTKGVHVVVDQSRFPLHNPVYFDVPDGRMVFAIPRDKKAYIGTTDTDYHGDPRRPRATQADIDYLVDCVNYMFPSVQLTPRDIESFWAGIRPLVHEEGKGPSEISRKDEVIVSTTGLITIAGGKLTGYRKMAEKIVDLVADQLSSEEGRQFSGCVTQEIELSGGKFGGSEHMPAYVQSAVDQCVGLGLAADAAERLVKRYGTNAEVVISMLPSDAEADGLPKDMIAQLKYGIEHEMVVTPSDFFVRRTSDMYFNIARVQKWKKQVVEYMSEALGWTSEQRSAYESELEERIADATEVLS